MKDPIRPGYTRVSTILDMVPSVNQGKWSHPMQQIDPYILAKAAERGTNVHEAIEAHFQDMFYDPSEEELPYLSSFFQWYSNMEPVAVDHEMRLYDDLLKVTGAIDLLAHICADNLPMIIDFKTTSAPDLKKWQLQAGFYYYLCERNNIEVEKTVIFVHLQKDGGAAKNFEFSGVKCRNLSLNLFSIYQHLTNC